LPSGWKHRLRKAVAALAIGNVGFSARRCDRPAQGFSCGTPSDCPKAVIRSAIEP
jgi:hypothetical protein